MSPPTGEGTGTVRCYSPRAGLLACSPCTAFAKPFPRAGPRPGAVLSLLAFALVHSVSTSFRPSCLRPAVAGTQWGSRKHLLSE